MCSTTTARPPGSCLMKAIFQEHYLQHWEGWRVRAPKAGWRWGFPRVGTLIFQVQWDQRTIRQVTQVNLRAWKFLEQCRNQYFKLSFIIITATHSEDIKRNFYFDNSRRWNLTPGVTFIFHEHLEVVKAVQGETRAECSCVWERECKLEGIRLQGLWTEKPHSPMIWSMGAYIIKTKRTPLEKSQDAFQTVTLVTGSSLPG